MSTEQEKNSGFFQQQSEKIITRVEKTPMEKFFLFFLVLISISAVVLGFMQFKKNIEGPALSSYLDRKRGELIDKYKSASVVNQEEWALRLKDQDSDLDGLDDWSEIYVYGTSPYLSDTDNDGISDKDEVIRGSNPNCPEGLDCTMIASSGTGYIDENELENINNAINKLGAADLQTIMQYESDLMAGKITLEQLGIYNPELQSLFNQMGAETALNENSSDEKSRALAEVQNMTPAQLRAELLDRGIDKATLDQMDDQTLMLLLNQIISAY